MNRGEPFWQAFGALLEHLQYNADGEARTAALTDRPASVGDVGIDAMVAAMAEDLASSYGLSVPEWCQDSRYFLPTGSEYWRWSSPRGRRYLEGHTREPYLSRGVRVPPDILSVV